MENVKKVLSNRLKKKFTPPDNGDICWKNDSESFTREEVAYLLYTQIAMIKNDTKGLHGIDLNYIRIPKF